MIPESDRRPAEPLAGEHQANDPPPIDWKRYHENGKTLTLKAKRRNTETQGGNR